MVILWNSSLIEAFFGGGKTREKQKWLNRLKKQTTDYNYSIPDFYRVDLRTEKPVSLFFPPPRVLYLYLKIATKLLRIPWQYQVDAVWKEPQIYCNFRLVGAPFPYLIRIRISCWINIGQSYFLCSPNIPL